MERASTLHPTYTVEGEDYIDIAELFRDGAELCALAERKTPALPTSPA
jgi:hypothetical protein